MSWRLIPLLLLPGREQRRGKRRSALEVGGFAREERGAEGKQDRFTVLIFGLWQRERKNNMETEPKQNGSEPVAAG